MLIQSISETKLDIIGDIHGEISALENLLQHLGYGDAGEHPEGRKLVFVGDLVDRGENSWAVYKRVQACIESGNAYCILGNHELNLLITDKTFGDNRPKIKPGNEWFHGLIELVKKDDETSIQPQFLLRNNEERMALQNFLRTLPLVIEAPGIRIVHSCWNNCAIQALKEDTRSPEVIHDHYERLCHQKIGAKVREHLSTYPETNPENLGVKDWLLSQDRGHPLRVFSELTLQNDNPIKVVTSGLEKPLEPNQEPYIAGKKIRYVQRDRWWTTYTDDAIVLCGHYWRTAPHPDFPTPIPLEDKRNIPPTFLPREGPFHWLGPKQNVMCIDYSVGKRFLERHHDATPGSSGSFLASLRYTRHHKGFSTQLIFDDGRIVDIQT